MQPMDAETQQEGCSGNTPSRRRAPTRRSAQSGSNTKAAAARLLASDSNVGLGDE